MNGPQDQQQASQGQAGKSALQHQQEAIKENFSSAPAASPVISCPKGALTEQQAQERFDKFKSREDIPWDYPQDCCYNRAHVMAKELEAEGVEVGKVWNYAPPPSTGNALCVQTPHDPSGYVEWSYHVAPTVPVMDSKGKISRMVIDPSITKCPITPDQWKAIQGEPRSELVSTSAAPYYRSESGRVAPTPTDNEVKGIFDLHRERRKELLSEWNASR